MSNTQLIKTISEGDILKSEFMKIIPVNTVGVMGAGLAKQVKDKYPDIFRKYKNMCEDGFLQIGMPRIIDTFIMFPTKDHWKNPSKMEYIVKGFMYLNDTFKPKIDTFLEINSNSEFPATFPQLGFACPALGTGLGGLSWKDVYPVILKFLLNFNVPCEIYLPHKT